jgi:hypothetical protein
MLSRYTCALTNTTRAAQVPISMLRTLHLYLGTFFAPAIIFFAFSGVLQVLGLHEAEDAEAARAPVWIETIARLHKDQRLARPPSQKIPSAIMAMRAEHEQRAAHDHPTGDEKPEASPRSVAQIALKAFVVLMAIGLIVSAALGIVIALRNSRTRRVATLMLALGVVLPVATLMF